MRWVVGKPCAGKPHPRFEVAGDGDQEVVKASQAPFLDPTTRTRFACRLRPMSYSSIENLPVRNHGQQSYG